jgi:pimeloyl-ACP methyl ester carboxylesterase
MPSMTYAVQGSGPAVLLLHGIPTSGRLWDYVVPLLKRRYTCVVVDLPGAGESPPLADGSLDPARYAQELEALRRHLEIPAWHVVGHDAGAAIAVHYAAQFGDRLNALVLCSPPIFPEFKIPWPFRLLRLPLLGECLAPLMELLIWQIGMPSTITRRDPSAAQIIAAFHRPYAGYRGMRRFLRMLRWGDPAQVLAKTAGLLPQISAPTLLIQGKADGAIPISFAARAAALIPGAELHMMECGHFLSLNCPDAFGERVLQFLDQVG